MNRIYQGRVSSIQIPDAVGTLRPAPLGDPATCPLWRHHCVFQDAVNYYLLALGALATADSATLDPVELNLRTRLAEAWESFPRPNSKDKLSLRASICPWLGLEKSASMEDAMKVILAENDACAELRSLAFRAFLSTILADKESPAQDGRVRNASKNLELFVLRQHAKAYPFESMVAEQAAAKKLKSVWIHSLEPQEVGARLEFHHYAKINKKNGARTPKASKERLVAAVTCIVEDEPQKLRLFDLINQLGEEFEFPNESPGTVKGAFRRTFDAFLILKYVIADEFTLSLLRECEKRPSDKALQAEKSAAPTTKAAGFSWEGKDPILAARSTVGYAFRAFTSFPCWDGQGPGTWSWKGFEIAAFAEALKALNQFNQKTEDREKTRLSLETQRARMLGQVDGSSSAGDEEETLPVLGGDPRFDLVKTLEKDLTERLMLDPSDPFKISRAALRGFRDLAEKWIQAKSRDAGKLQGVVKNYQADPKNQREVGSIPLMLALCEADYHSLWLAADEAEQQRRADEHRPSDMLSAVCRFHQLEADLMRARQPIRLTPAEPEASRRLYMFSGLTGRSASKFKGTGSVEVSLAYQEKGSVRECRAVLGFSAPRLKRDELTGGIESRWLQPMTSALFGEVGEFNPKSTKHGVALMPSLKRTTEGTEARHLLNLPYTLNPCQIISAVYNARGQVAKVSWDKKRGVINKSFWQSQFHENWEGKTFKGRDFLMWSGTKPNKSKPILESTDKDGWWNHPVLVKNGFTLLANDLGQRSAGAWSLLKVTCWKPDTKRPLRSIGHDGSREWFAEVLKTGMHRLPGEEVKIQNGGAWNREKYGAAGRLATEEEHAAALASARDLGIESSEKWLGAYGKLSFPELNDQLLKIANRRLSRLGTYHRWSCFNPEKIESPERRAKAVGNLRGELDSYQDNEVLAWKPLLETSDFAAFRDATGRAFENLRDHLEEVLVRIANLTAPVRRKLWTWQGRHDGTGYGDLVLLEFIDNAPKIRGQRGLSMQRLEQLENLRRVFLRYNRSLDRQPGVPAKFGREDRGRESGEPCQELLGKIDQMKDQRVNQTAHLILAQALGVRLKEHGLSEDERRERDIHGEYEKIPGREPVDFIVIEDLSRYLSSQGRAPSENSRLMKWAHRAIRDKLKMLSEEPFGIPVVEVVPAYSSRFHAVNGQPGSRLHEFHQLESFHRQSLERLKERTDRSERRRAAAAGELLAQFDAIAMTNARRIEAKKKPHSLYFPKAGGPLFLAAKDGSPVQADLNAATNLGLRAIAAPACIEIHRRIRGSKESEIYRPRMDNAREKAAFSKSDVIRIIGGISKKFGKSTTPNFFHEPDALKQPDGDDLFDRAELNGHALVSGVALWSMANDAIFIRCVELNSERLKAWGIRSESEPVAEPEEEDEIPM